MKQWHIAGAAVGIVKDGRIVFLEGFGKRDVAKGLSVHVILDNYATHKHPRVKRWLASRSRYQVHFTPTYASWLNQVEIWFNIITQKAIRPKR